MTRKGKTTYEYGIKYVTCIWVVKEMKIYDENNELISPLVSFLQSLFQAHTFNGKLRCNLQVISIWSIGTFQFMSKYLWENRFVINKEAI